MELSDIIIQLRELGIRKLVIECGAFDEDPASVTTTPSAFAFETVLPVSTSRHPKVKRSTWPYLHIHYSQGDFAYHCLEQHLKQAAIEAGDEASARAVKVFADKNAGPF